MKVQDRVMDVTSTLQGEKIAMTIDMKSLPHLMGVLTDLYSDPELAVIREYSTNAFDAHVDSGVKRPIEVTLPTSLAPFFTVRDYGEGLNAKDIREIYSQYGASTKRNSNDVVGMLGLGCKSALTYTDQFTLIGIKNGVATQVSVSRDADSSASMTIVDQRKSDEPSGVEVIVPAKRSNSFEEKAADFFQFWTEGTVLVNGQKPKRIDGIWLSDDLMLSTKIDQSYVVMGNVAYPVLEGMSPSYSVRYWHDIHTVAFVDIGDVLFTPSRESLQDVKITRETLAKIKERVKKEKNVAFQKMIEGCKDKVEALNKYLEVKSLGYDGDPSYQGSSMPTQWAFAPPADPQKTPRTKFVTLVGVKRHRGKGWSVDTYLPLAESNYYSESVKKYIWITDYEYVSENSAFTPYKRLKLEQFFSRKGINKASNNMPDNFVLVKSLPLCSEWIDPSNVYSWKDIEKEKIIRDKTPRLDGRPTGSYDCFIGNKEQRGVKAADIDTSKPIFWEHGSSGYWGMSRPDGNDVVQSHHPDATIVILGRNRSSKFQRDFPTSKKVSTFCHEQAKSWVNSLTEAQKLALYMRNTQRDFVILKSLDADLVDDPKIKNAIKLVKSVPDSTPLHNKYQSLLRFGARLDYKWDDPLEKYALLTLISTYGTLRGTAKDHLHTYLNAAYAAEQEATCNTP